MSTFYTKKYILVWLVVALSGFAFVSTAYAERGDRDKDRNPQYERNSDRNTNQREKIQRNQEGDARQPRTIYRDRYPTQDKRISSRTAPVPRDFVLDRKYNHDRYYPPAGYFTPRLPERYRVLEHHHVRYFYNGGIWYRRSATGFIVVIPPIGVGIPVLPPFYTVIWVGSVPYYYANGIYYVWYPAQQAYVVSSPPPDSITSDQPAELEQLFVYPKNGQSEKQQEKDRYECHKWAMDKTGFDPTRAGGDVPEAEYYSKRSDYNRAIKACLEARGYSVK